MCPGVDSAPSENEYQEHFMGVKAAGAWGWQPHHLHVPNVMEIWELKPPGTIWATPGLLLDCFTFYIIIIIIIIIIMFLVVQNSTLPFWKLSAYACRIEILESVDFLLFTKKRRKCPSARCPSAVRAIGSDSFVLNGSSVWVNDLPYFHNFLLDKFSFNFSTLVIN